MADVVERNDQDGSTGTNSVFVSDEKSAPKHLEEDGYSPWLVVTHKKQGTKNTKKGSGAEFQKIVHSDNHVSDKDQMTSLKMGFSKDGKRKRVGLRNQLRRKAAPVGCIRRSPPQISYLSPTVVQRAELVVHTLGPLLQ